MREREQGFTLIEVLIALVIFAIVAIGALAALGATTSSGFLGAFPTSFSTVRQAKDFTAAATYLQSLDDYIASKGKNVAPPDTYCMENVSGACSPVPVKLLPSWGQLSGPPVPSTQLGWTKLDVLIQQWYWDAGLNAGDGGYCLVGSSGCSAAASGDYILYVSSTLSWSFSGRIRSVATSRFFSCSVSALVSLGCP